MEWHLDGEEEEVSQQRLDDGYNGRPTIIGQVREYECVYPRCREKDVESLKELLDALST